MNENEKLKCNYKCVRCQNREKETDFCKVKGIEDCSKKAPTEFSTCNDYLVDANLVMF
jgi:hypothetical protein